MEKALTGEVDGKKAAYPRTASIKDNVVTIKHVTQLLDGKHYMTTRVDLSGEDGDDIMVNAAYNYLIQDLRPRALKPHKSTDIDENRTYRPCDYPATGGAGIDKRERIIRFFMDTEDGMGLDREDAEYAVDHPSEIGIAMVSAMRSDK